MNNSKINILSLCFWMTFIMTFLVMKKDVKSQYQTNQELGFLTGVSYYYGDLNSGDFVYLNPKFLCLYYFYYRLYSMNK